MKGATKKRTMTKADLAVAIVGGMMAGALFALAISAKVSTGHSCVQQPIGHTITYTIDCQEDSLIQKDFRYLQYLDKYPEIVAYLYADSTGWKWVEE